MVRWGALSRRTLLQLPFAAAEEPEIRREVFLRAPGNGTAVMACAFYTGLQGGGMMSLEQRWSRSDTVDVAYCRRSSDYERTWSPPQEHVTGERRPESMLQRHPWARGNRPRYPFVIAEVDRNSGLALRPRVRTADTLQPGKDPLLTLSNFYAREDRQTREICVHMTRLFAREKGWEGGAMRYRIPV